MAAEKKKFIRNCWYVAAWSHEITVGQVAGRKIIGDRLALYRDSTGKIVCLEDRCSHRWAPLSQGRVDGDLIQCLYHGLTFRPDGNCHHIPGADSIASCASVRAYPAVEMDSWIWVWMGEASKADEGLIPVAFGIDDEQWVMRANQLDYEADYELINDNLCDLSHLDFVHENTLGRLSGAQWSANTPRVTQLERGLRIERWFTDIPASPYNPVPIDVWTGYDYLVPGVFLISSGNYAAGTAQRSQFQKPSDSEIPLTRSMSQHAVTPIVDQKTRYFFASGFFGADLPPELRDSGFEVVAEAFDEDKAIIEAQQVVWNETDSKTRKTFISHDKAPHLFRKMIKKLMKEEAITTDAKAETVGA